MRRTGTRSWRATRRASSPAAGAVDSLTTAADVDRAGAVCWEAHANEGRRPLEWGDCCEAECGDKPADDGDGNSTCRTVYFPEGGSHGGVCGVPSRRSMSITVFMK